MRAAVSRTADTPDVDALLASLADRPDVDALLADLARRHSLRLDALLEELTARLDPPREVTLEGADPLG